MEINIEAPWKVKAYQANVIKKKLMKLTTFSNQIVRAKVFLKSKVNVGIANKAAEVKLQLPGSSFFAESCADSHEKAIAECSEKLRRQIVKRKGKMASR